MILSFQLTMPGVASWNGKWTGADKKYFTHRKVNKNHPIEIKNGASYTFRWEDGWMARVTVSQVDSKTRQKEQKVSAGFYGYEWMVDSILTHGKIVIE